MCAKSGFGIVDQGGNYIRFDAKGNEQAKQLLEKSTKKDHLRVNVTGTKEGDVIHVQSLSLVQGGFRVGASRQGLKSLGENFFRQPRTPQAERFSKTNAAS